MRSVGRVQLTAASCGRYVVQVGALAAVYFAAAKAGLLLATVGAQVTLVWPPTGLALAALLLGGLRLWPGVALGATLVNASTGVSLATACGMGTGNTVEALIAAGLLRHLRVQPSLERLRDVFALVALAAGLSTIASATIGVTTASSSAASSPGRPPCPPGGRGGSGTRSGMSWWRPRCSSGQRIVPCGHCLAHPASGVGQAAAKPHGPGARWAGGGVRRRLSSWWPW